MAPTGVSSSRLNPAHARRRARRLAMQALYQCQVSGESSAAAARHFHDEQDFSRADQEYFDVLLREVWRRRESLDELLAAHAHLDPVHVEPVERAILRIAAFELQNRPEVPVPVILGEAIRLAKDFGGAESHKFINAVLDRLATGCRPAQARSPNP